MRKLNYKLLGLAFLAVSFTACDEEGLGANGEVEAAMGELYVEAESAASRMFKHADEAMRKLDAGDPLPYTINEATFDEDATTPGTYFLDYGAGKTPGGVLTEGKLIITRTGSNYLTPGSSVGIGFDEYKEAGKPITGSITATNVSDANTTKFELDVAGLTVVGDESTDEDGNTVPGKALELTSDKTLEWTAGAATLNDISDDVYTLSNTAGGTGTSAKYDSEQYTFTINLTSPLKIDNSCSFRLLEGVIDLDMSTTIDPSPLAFDKASIDFLAGDGANSDGCDGFFEISLENTETGAKVSDLTRQFKGF